LQGYEIRADFEIAPLAMA